MEIRSQSELARLLGCSQTNISRWVTYGMPHELRTLSYFFNLDSVIRWLESRGPRYQKFVANLKAEGRIPQKKAPATTEAIIRNPDIKTTTKNGGID